MAWWGWTLIGIYFFGFLFTIVTHALLLQMVTFPLALLRSIVWPIYVLTGWPGGSPLTMD